MLSHTSLLVPLSLLLIGCSPTPSPDSVVPAPTSAPVLSSAQSTAAPATPAPSGTSAQRVQVPYTGSITLAQMLKGVDDLCADVEQRLTQAKKTQYSDRIAMLLAMGPIGIRVHDEFMMPFLAAQMGVDVMDLEAFLDAPERDAEQVQLKKAKTKMEQAFASYKAHSQGSKLPTATKGSCLAAKKQYLEYVPKTPAPKTKLTKEVVEGVLVPLIVSQQALKRCKDNGHACIADAATVADATACK